MSRLPTDPAGAAPRRPGRNPGRRAHLVDAEDPPLRVFFGETPLAIATADYEHRLATWNEWQSLSLAAHGGQG